MKKLLLCRCSEKWADFAPFVLRIVVGIIFVVHGYQKYAGGMDGVAGFFGSLGIPMPMFFAYVVTFVELFGGLALILGLFTHWAAKLLAVDMIVAIALVHYSNGLTGQGGMEFTLTLLAVLISLMITGAGAWSLDRKMAK